DHHAAGFHPRERGEIGLERPHGLLAVQFHQVVEAGLPHVARLHTQGVDEAGRRDRGGRGGGGEVELDPRTPAHGAEQAAARMKRGRRVDRKSTRLNSSHVSMSYAVFCLKNKKKTKYNT